MLLLRKLLRATKIVWTFAYSITELLVRRPASRFDRAAWLSRFCRRALLAVDISWTAIGPVPAQGAVISNHLTYIDVMVLAALRPCSFVAAIEIRRMPLIGWLSMMAGTVYVERGAGGSAARAAGSMAESFRDGVPIVFFPEGGTGVGDDPLLPLRSGLLATTLEAGATVTPGYLHYELSPEDIAEGRSTREDVHWGTQTLPAHIWNFLGVHKLTATIRFAPAPIAFSPEALANRKIAADEARGALLALADRIPERLRIV